jgi:hypothetical protein
MTDDSLIGHIRRKMKDLIHGHYRHSSFDTVNYDPIKDASLGEVN